MKVAVVGHVEWIEFVRVERVPSQGEIVHAQEVWSEAAGGGAVAAVQLARLAGRSTLFTAVGEDELGARVAPALADYGVEVHTAVRPEPQRRGFTYVDATGELLCHHVAGGGAHPLVERRRVDSLAATGAREEIDEWLRPRQAAGVRGEDAGLAAAHAAV